MKKLIFVLLLCGIYCNSIYATESKEASFEKYPTKDSKLIEYKTPIDEQSSFSLFVNTIENIAVPVLTLNNKKYQAVSIRYCVNDTDECWRIPIYGDLLSEFIGHINNENIENNLLWSIEYVEDNKVNFTPLLTVPKLGDLSIYLDSENADVIDDVDEKKSSTPSQVTSENRDPQIIWQSDVQNY